MNDVCRKLRADKFISLFSTFTSNHKTNIHLRSMISLSSHIKDLKNERFFTIRNKYIHTEYNAHHCCADFRDDYC
jgi:hypothetical protein